MKFLQTRKGKIVMNMVYGLGAAVVIVGAWGKILHKSWANMAITIGLLTEAGIFTISAFEPPHEDVDWSLVYPELAGMPGEGGHGKTPKITDGDGVTQELDKLLSDAKIGPELIESLGDGMRKLSDSTTKLSTIGDATEANAEYANNVKAAAQNVNKLSESYVKTAEALNTSISPEDGQVYGEQLQRVSKNLSALNSVYELQIQGSKEYVESSAKAYSNINEMLQHLSQSVEDTKRYKEEIHVLSQNLAALNTVYGNMLSAMNFRPNA